MLGDPRDPNSLSTKLRKRRDVLLRELIQSIADRQGSVNILDVGGTFEYWRRVGVDFLREAKVTIVLLNLHSSELTDIAGFEDVFSKAVGDGCDLAQYADGQFDLVHSNSVVEHVITWANMRAFAREVRRVGRSYYAQTPYFWFPVDPHFYRMPIFHWLPKPMRAGLLHRFPIAYSGRVPTLERAYEIIDGTRLLDRGQFKILFPDADLTYERFGGLPKSLIGIRRAPDKAAVSA